MIKLIELFNTLIKHKVIKHPKYFLITVLILAMLGVPSYVKNAIENGVHSVFAERQDMQDRIIKYRGEISGEIDKILKNLRLRLGADRTFLGEYSNTVTGLTGLHFLYFTINNEDVKPGITSIASNYQKQNNSNFKTMSRVFTENTVAIRDIEEIKYYDPITYAMVKKNSTKQMYLMYFELHGTPIGFVGVSYADSTYRDTNKIFYEESVTLRDLSDLFDYKEKLKKK